MRMNEYALAPYVGALPIMFGMGPLEVATLVGPADTVGDTCHDDREEVRGPLMIRYSSQSSQVVEIAFLPSATLLYKGVDLFTKADVIRFLAQYDRPLEIVGFVVFMNLGITMTGFHDNDASQKAIVAFSKGRMDEFRNDLTPL
jgi:hypothetical protein